MALGRERDGRGRTGASILHVDLLIHGFGGGLGPEGWRVALVAGEGNCGESYGGCEIESGCWVGGEQVI
jgi:hypothetical protein